MRKLLTFFVLAGFGFPTCAAAEARVFPEYLPLGAEELSGTVGHSLEVIADFFEKFGRPITIDKDGKPIAENYPSPEEYRLGRDAASNLQRATSLRLLTAGGVHIGRLLTLATKGEPMQRRGAIWLLTRPGDVKAPAVPEMILDQLASCRFDPDWQIRAIMAGIPHGGGVGAFDENGWVRAAWILNWTPPGGVLDETGFAFLTRGLIDTHPFARTAARHTADRLAEQVPQVLREQLSEMLAALKTDPSPWPRTELVDMKLADRGVSWVFNLSSWAPLFWKQPTITHPYRDGDVGNPDVLVKRLEFLRSAASNPSFSLETLRNYAEPELRATAAILDFGIGRETEATVASRLKLIEDPDTDVRLAAVLTFAPHATHLYPESAIGEIRRYILGGLASTSTLEHAAAVELARGLKSKHGGGAGNMEWVAANLNDPAKFPKDAAPHVAEVKDTLTQPQLAPRWYLPEDHDQLVQLARSPAPEIWMNVLPHLVSRGPEQMTALIRVLALDDERDARLRAALPKLLREIPRAESTALLAPARAISGRVGETAAAIESAIDE